MGIKLIVGLGNPGPQYANTRHNVGWWLVQSLAASYQGSFSPTSKFKGLLGSINVAATQCMLLLPTTFMNLSGSAVSSIMSFYKLDLAALLVVHDELDFLPGIIRFKYGGGANGHNGVQSIIDQLGSGNFWRLRIGIGKAAVKQQVRDYVLASPHAAEAEKIHTAINHVVNLMPQVITGNIAKAMAELHRVEL